MMEMRVLFLQPQPCIRTLKYAKVLRKALKNNVFMAFGYLYKTLTERYGYSDELFDGFVKLDERSIRDELVEQLKGEELLKIRESVLKARYKFPSKIT